MIGRVQEHLEAIYAIRSDWRASEFLVTPEVARALGATGRSREELLIREEGEFFEIALYLAPELLQALEHYETAPGAYVVDGALESYCQLAEGVSHFLYVTQAATLERKVSLLEIEAQAEIDKFASCILYGWKRGVHWARELMRRLFERVAYLPTLAAHERWRYEEANRLALNYCRRLLRHISADRMDRFLSDLRYAYRLGAEAKLRHLALPA